MFGCKCSRISEAQGPDNVPHFKYTCHQCTYHIRRVRKSPRESPGVSFGVSEPLHLEVPKILRTLRASPINLLDRLPLVSREWKNGSNSSYNCTPFLHSLLTKGKTKALALRKTRPPVQVSST